MTVNFISIKERLPDRGGSYLCLCDKWGDFQHQILTFYPKSGHFRKRNNTASGFFAGLMDTECPGTEDMTKYVTHWMELPEEDAPDELDESAAASASGEVLVKHNYRNVKLALGTTITVDVEELKERRKREIYKDLMFSPFQSAT